MKNEYKILRGGVVGLGLLFLTTGPSGNVRAQSLRPAQPAPTTSPQGPDAAPLHSNDIHFGGEYSATSPFPFWRYNPIELCPNSATIQGPQPAPLAYVFKFSQDCDGEDGSPWGTGTYRPPFIWTLRFTTESGHYYNQQWEDATTFEHSKVRFYMFDRVPGAGIPGYHPFVAGGPYIGGNPRVSPWYNVNGGGGGAIQTNATAGEIITGAEIECTGYNCWGGWNYTDVVGVRYKGLRPKNLAIVGNHPELCRSQTYTLTWNPSFGATGYVVQSSVGTVTYTGGTTAQLTLPVTTPGSVANAVITVGTLTTGRSITPSSAITTLTVPLAPAPRPGAKPGVYRRPMP